MKYNRTIVKHITDMISSDEYTIEEICRAVKISKDTYYQWLNKKADFSDAIKKAEEKRMNFFKTEARRAAAKKITGYDYEEVSTVVVEGKDGRPRIKEKKTTKKHVPPDTAMVIFVLKNTDPDNFKDSQFIDHNVTMLKEMDRIASMFPTEEEWNEAERKADQ